MITTGGDRDEGCRPRKGLELSGAVRCLSNYTSNFLIFLTRVRPIRVMADCNNNTTVIEFSGFRGSPPRCYIYIYT